MGPRTLPKKQKKEDKPKSTRSTKQVEKIPLKRFLMQRRRIDSLLCDNDSLTNKNKEVLESLQNEKMANASLRKELYHVQRLYHEALHTVNTYKVQQVETSKTMSTIIREINNTYPNILAVTDFVSGTKMKISKMLSTLPSDYVSNQYSDNRSFNQSSGRKSGNPMKQRVGPMVRGMLITKPKIMLERILVPPAPQDPEQTSNDMPAEEENNQLTPIQESNEPEEDSGLELGHVTVRPRRRMGFRVRSKGNLNKNREKAKEKKVPHRPVFHDDSSDSESNTARHVQPEVTYNDDSSDSESNDATGRIEQVLFNGVSHMLQNSPLVKVPRVSLRVDEISPSNLEQCRLPKNSGSRQNDHPLEGVPGCSWMYPAYPHNSANLNSQSSFRSSRSNERHSSSDDSLYKPPDIDGNDAMVVSQNRTPDKSVMDTLVMRNHSCVSPDNCRSSAINSSTPAQDHVLASAPIEPDSTNNIEDTLRRGSYKKHSNNHKSLSSSIVSGSDSSRVSSNFLKTEQKTSINNTTVTVRINKTPGSFNSSSSPVDVTSFNKRQSNNIHQRQSNLLVKRKSSFIESGSLESSSLILTGKRIRKPKSNMYPGEESSSPPSKIKRNNQEKLIVKRSLKAEKRNSKGKISIGARLSRGSGEHRKSITNAAKASTNNAVAKRKTNPMNKQSKKSSIKLSINTPRNSTEETHQVSGSEASRPQRRRQPVSYKESPLNTKQRRP